MVFVISCCYHLPFSPALLDTISVDVAFLSFLSQLSLVQHGVVLPLSGSMCRMPFFSPLALVLPCRFAAAWRPRSPLLIVTRGCSLFSLDATLLLCCSYSLPIYFRFKSLDPGPIDLVQLYSLTLIPELFREPISHKFQLPLPFLLLALSLLFDH
jgi:hypothetical protein